MIKYSLKFELIEAVVTGIEYFRCTVFVHTDKAKPQKAGTIILGVYDYFKARLEERGLSFFHFMDSVDTDTHLIWEAMSESGYLDRNSYLRRFFVLWDTKFNPQFLTHGLLVASLRDFIADIGTNNIATLIAFRDDMKKLHDNTLLIPSPAEGDSHDAQLNVSRRQLESTLELETLSHDIVVFNAFRLNEIEVAAQNSEKYQILRDLQGNDEVVTIQIDPKRSIIVNRKEKIRLLPLPGPSRPNLSAGFLLDHIQ
jgi:hypothetical protein